MTLADTHTVERVADLLAEHPDYRVLRRFRSPTTYRAIDDPSALLSTGLFVDCETTGLDTATAAVIELALVPFVYQDDGGAEVGAPLHWYEDPGVPIPAEVTALTGITDDMVRGARIDDLAVAECVAKAWFVVAHNADFDRKILERRLPVFAHVPWACSYRDVPWQQYGCTGAKLQHILADTCGEFYEAHRAVDDALVGVHVLATARRDGRTALAELLSAAHRPTARVWAVGAPFSVKDALKGRGYRWSDGSIGLRAWYRDLTPTEVDSERVWLRENAFVRDAKVVEFGALDRYSMRAGV